MTAAGRRQLLRLAGAGAAVPLAASATPAQTPPAASGYGFLRDADVVFLRAAVDRLIPQDGFPGAWEAGVVTYIDRQLGGPYGRAERLYLAPPHQASLPQQGYQLGLAPAALYRTSLDALTSHPLGRAFPGQPTDEQDSFLRDLEAGRWQFGPVNSAVFFETLLANTIEGYFADPLYGGNRHMVGWRMVGFPGAFAQFVQWVGRHNVRFNRPPMSIAMNAATPGHGHGGVASPGDARVPASARPGPTSRGP